MFRKILIANRGEIALRVAATCRRLGVATVAVHSDADAAAMHALLADEAVSLGGNRPDESYLRGEAIIAAALERGAQAIHPGYGFLSENPDFVEAVEAAGLVFIGPSASAIRAMGLKDAAKALMARAGVPVVPGWQGEDQDPDNLAAEAGAIGYPVLIKAVAGGGGKGMRRVERPADFAAALAAARAEARGAFGNAAVLIEKYIDHPRHIEVQVFGDGERAVHLYERDCSLQRRHQKVIEEAPAPGMTPDLRAAMGAAATRAAEAIGYRGAGTVEFIVDASQGLRPDGFWFMEMNTRLQVEHPVTEAVTGLDLVEWQLRVASGEPLPLTQDQIRLRGHAVEARLYAEDVPAGFLPATGRLAHLRFPQGARVETGVREGDVISPWYDPMIAKIITHGPTRGAALNLMQQALAETEVAGTVTNLAFLGRLVADENVRAGRVDTALIGRHLADLARDPPTQAPVCAMAALAALGLTGDQGPLTGFTLWAPLERHVLLEAGGAELAAVVRTRGPGDHLVTVGGAEVEARLHRGEWRLDGRKLTARVDADMVAVFGQGCWTFTRPDPLALAAEEAAAALTLSPMPGLVKAVPVVVGQPVVRGQVLAVLEAMKMEHSLTATRDGVVAEVLVAAGQQVEHGAPLIRLEDEGG